LYKRRFAKPVIETEHPTTTPEGRREYDRKYKRLLRGTPKERFWKKGPIPKKKKTKEN